MNQLLRAVKNLAFLVQESQLLIPVECSKIQIGYDNNKLVIAVIFHFWYTRKQGLLHITKVLLLLPHLPYPQLPLTIIQVCSALPSNARLLPV